MMSAGRILLFVSPKIFQLNSLNHFLPGLGGIEKDKTPSQRVKPKFENKYLIYKADKRQPYRLNHDGVSAIL